MSKSRKKLIFKNVAPAILANACVFLFSVVDGIFVGQGAGMDALGAVNLALPFVLIVQALNAMASIGGVTVTAFASDEAIKRVHRTPLCTPLR